MPYSWSETNVKAVQDVLDTHDAALGLEEHAGGDVQVWHLLMSVREFCDAKGLAFDDILDEVRSEDPAAHGLR